MAEDMADVARRLPTEFLADDFFSEKNSNGGLSFPAEFPFSWEYGSPLESEASDEEDYMAGLTRRMAHSFLHDDEKSSGYPVPGVYSKAMAPVGSPQSPLCALSGGNESGSESSNGPSLVSSPPSSPLELYKDDAWDLLYAAAGQVMRMKLKDEPGQQQRAALGLLEHPVRKPVAACHYITARSQHQHPAHQVFKQQHQVSGAWNRHNKVLRGGNTRGVRQQGFGAAAWAPPFQQQANSGMRAVFLGVSSRRESCGTGVFLPRRADSPADFRKKPACATVLLPARVVQALNLDLEELGVQSRLTGGFSIDHGSVAARRSFRPQPEPVEMRLPSEWTY
ncbi:TIP41-like protein [Wolffia australiana]